MGFRFFSIPGVRPIRGGKGLALPDPKEDPRFADYFSGRPETSHGVLGLDPGMNVDISIRGDVRHGTVVREVGDEKTGKASVFVRSERGDGKKEVHRLDFEPHKARSMIQVGQPHRVKE
jgi:hypothetical protein